MGHYINGYYVFAPVTSTDRAGILWVATILSFLFSVIVLLTRYHVKKRTFGKDDWLITAATVIAMGQYIALFVGMDRYALGKSSPLLTEAEATGAGRSVFASNCLFIVALALSKFSVVYFMKRLFTRDFHTAWVICNILIGAVAAWVVASMLILTVGCGPATKLVGHRCAGQLLRWSLVAGLDTLFEIVIVFLSIILVWPLQMPLDVKLMVILAFFFRVFVAVFAGIHVSHVPEYIKNPDPGLTIVTGLVWQQIELGYALISATIPTLKSFISGYEKAMGWQVSYTRSDTGPTPGMFGTASVQMHSLGSKNSDPRSQDRDLRINADLYRDSGDIRPKLRPDKHKYKASVVGPHQGDQLPKLKRQPSTGSSESQNPIIRKEVNFTISSETAPTSPWHAVG